MICHCVMVLFTSAIAFKYKEFDQEFNLRYLKRRKNQDKKSCVRHAILTSSMLGGFILFIVLSVCYLTYKIETEYS